MKPALRCLLVQRMEILLDNAVRNAKSAPDLSRRQAMLAQRLSTRNKIRMPYRLKMLFCKRCKSFITPGHNSRIRLGRTPVKAVRISCRFCGHTYRKIIP